MITVTVTDNGGTTSGGVNTFSQSFTVMVLPVNQPPVFNTPANPAAILENAGTQSLIISGIGPGLGDPSQVLSVSAASGNPGLIPNVGVTYTSPQSLAALTYTPVANASGTAVITVTVTDNGGTANGGVNTVTKRFTVTVTPVNQQPQIDPIPSVTLNENSPLQTINLSGINAGPGRPGADPEHHRHQQQHGTHSQSHGRLQQP